MVERESSSDAAAMGLRAGLALLRRNPDFRKVYVAQLISFGGDWFLVVALFGLVDRLTGSPILVALTIGVQELTFFLFSPVGGWLADRLDRRRLMIAADLARAVLSLGFLLVTDAGDVWLVYVLLASMSVFSAAFEPATSAATPNVVDPEDLAVANSLVGSAWGTMLAVGAAVGGLVAATLGKDAAFLGDSLSFVLSGVLLWRVRRAFSEERPEDHEHPSIVAATRETVHYARRDHRVLALLVVKGGFGLAAGVLVLIAVFATDVFRKGEIGIGLLMGARGLGAFVGPFLGHRVSGRGDRHLFTAIGLSLAVFGASYMAFSFTTSLAMALPIVFCAHLGGGAQWALSTYGLQLLVPDYIRGRIFAFDYALITVTLGLSSIAAGWASERFGPRVSAIGLGLVALGWAAVWWVATRRVRRAPLLREPERELAGKPGAELA